MILSLDYGFSVHAHGCADGDFLVCLAQSNLWISQCIEMYHSHHAESKSQLISSGKPENPDVTKKSSSWS